MRDEIKAAIILGLPEGAELHANPSGIYTVEIGSWVEGVVIYLEGTIIQGDDDGLYVPVNDLARLFASHQGISLEYLNVAVETEDTIAITALCEPRYRTRRHNGQLYSRIPLRMPTYVKGPDEQYRG